MSKDKVRKVDFKSETRTGKMEMRDMAFKYCTDVIDAKPTGLFNILSLPWKDWIFEEKLVRHMPRNYGNKKIIYLHTFEFDKKTYGESKLNIPKSLKAIVTEEECGNYDVTHSRYFENNIFINSGNLFDYLESTDKTFDFMWLDLTTTIDFIQHRIVHAQNRMNPEGVLIISFPKGREREVIPDRTQFVLDRLQDMALIKEHEYRDSLTMCNVILRKKLTETDLESYIDMGEEQIIKQPNTNKMQNLENNDQVATVTTTESKGKSLRIVVEKLDGGYVSDIQGKRRIYTKTDDIIDMIGMDDILNKLEHDQYHVNIDFIPKDEYVEQEDLRNILNQEKILSIAELKDAGIIEEAPKFNPFPKMEEPDLTALIKVTLSNAYSAARLQAIDWAEMHNQLPLMPTEVTRITGMNTTSLYASLPKARKGKMLFQHSATRIGFTVLAQYYEKTLGIRTSTQDKCEKMKEDLLKLIRDVELIGDKKSHVKTSDVSKKLVEMRKILM